MKEIIVYDHSISANNTINVRRIRRILEDDGTEIAKTFHRHVIDPVFSNIEEEDRRTQIIATAIRTPLNIPTLMDLYSRLDDDTEVNKEPIIEAISILLKPEEKEKKEPITKSEHDSRAQI